MNAYHHLSNADLLDEIGRLRSRIADAEASKGPIVARRFIEARIYPSLIAAYEERNRRMAARRA